MDWTDVYQDHCIQLRVSKNPPAWHLQAQPAATCLPVNAEGKFLLIREQKAAGHWVLGFPGGMLEEGESAELAAARECEEEIGLRPGRTKLFTKVETAFPDTSVSYVLGFDLTGALNLVQEEGEHVESVQALSFEQLYQMALNTELSDPRLIVAVLRLKKMVEEGLPGLNFLQ